MAKDYSSDTRVTLATAFPVFREIVLEYAKTDSSNEYIFTQQQIDNLYLSPHHTFLKKDIAEVGVALINLRKKIFSLRTDLLQQQIYLQQAVEQLRNRKHIIDPKVFSETERKLMLQYEKAEDSLQTLNALYNSEIKSLSGKLDQMMEKHDEQWRAHRKKFTEEMLKVLEEKNLIFEHEKKILAKQPTVAELLENFQE